MLVPSATLGVGRNEFAFAKTSGIVIGDALASYWPIFFPASSDSPRSLFES